jgi:hypothetical protein
MIPNGNLNSELLGAWPRRCGARDQAYQNHRGDVSRRMIATRADVQLLLRIHQLDHLTAFLSKETTVSAPSHLPSKASTPSAKSPPPSSTANPASTAGRVTTTFTLLIRRRIASAMPGEGILYPQTVPKPIHRAREVLGNHVRIGQFGLGNLALPSIITGHSSDKYIGISGDLHRWPAQASAATEEARYRPSCP